MPTEDGFDQDYPLPLFLIGRDEPLGVRKAYHRAVLWSRISKVSIVTAGVMAAAIAVLSAGEPATLLASVRASLVGDSEPRPAADRPDIAVRSSVRIKTPSAPPAAANAATAAPAETKAAGTAPTEKKVADIAPAESNAAAAAPAETKAAGTALSEIKAAGTAPGERSVADLEPIPAAAAAAASMGAGEDQAKKNEPSSDTLFMQFQAWSAARDAQADARSGQPAQDKLAPAQDDSAQDDSAKVAQPAPAPVAENSFSHEPRKKHHHARAVTHARKQPAVATGWPLSQSVQGMQPLIPGAQAARPSARNARPTSAAQSGAARFQAVRQQQDADARASFRALFGLDN